MRSKLAIYTSAIFLSFSYGPGAMAKEEQNLSGLALQQVQARDYESSVDVLFPAIVTVLQDNGYRITEADKTSGFVSGIGSAEKKLTFNFWFGVGQKKTVPMVSAFVEQRGPGIARARLNFVLSKMKSRNVYSDEKPVTDPAVYKDAFEAIEKEIFVRQAMNSPSTPAAPPAPAPAAVPAPAAQ